VPLPTEKTTPTLSIDRLTAVLVGRPKIGKTSTAAAIDNDHTLFIATEPGYDGINAFVEPCRSWEQFREIGAELANGEHDYKLVVVDTVDALQGMCTEHVIDGLARSAGKDPDQNFVHASDFEYGKGWSAITDEFKLRIAKLCTLGLGVIFISHAKESTKTDRVGREITVFSADVGQKGSRQWLLGYVNYIWFMDVEQTPDGEKHLLRTRASETYEAGGRGAPLPDPIDLGDSPEAGAAALKAALAQATEQLRANQEKKKPAEKPAEKEPAAA
jgi:hypothetical protein